VVEVAVASPRRHCRVASKRRLASSAGYVSPVSAISLPRVCFMNLPPVIDKGTICEIMQFPAPWPPGREVIMHRLVGSNGEVIITIEPTGRIRAVIKKSEPSGDVSNFHLVSCPILAEPGTFIMYFFVWQLPSHMDIRIGIHTELALIAPRNAPFRHRL
jgi:hypothetical protein